MRKSSNYDFLFGNVANELKRIEEIKEEAKLLKNRNKRSKTSMLYRLLLKNIHKIFNCN